jgi:Flp pilus assembly protein TadG
MTPVRDFFRRDGGALTELGLLLTIAMICVGGLALDVANATMVRTHLQVAADAAAHAALVARESQSEADARATALRVARTTLPRERFGDVIVEGDIEFGTWDSVNNVFTAVPGSRSAVQIDTRRIAARQNAVGTYFLTFIGMNHLDVARRSVFETYFPACLREGFVAEDVVDVTSSNVYTKGFCIHSNDHVEVQNLNIFQDGVVVSMPDRRDMVVPNSGAKLNEGLQSALTDAVYKLRILQRIDQIIAGVQNKDSVYWRSYITSTAPVPLSAKANLEDGWQEGRIHTVTCTNPNTQLSTRSGAKLKRGILITNCKLWLPSGVTFEDAVLALTGTHDDLFSAASGLTLGKNDGCAPGGDVQVVTKGGVRFAAGASFYGAQVLAAGDISFTSNALGVQGVSLVAGGRIDGTANSVMGFCGGAGMNNNFQAAYFRMAS